MDLQCTCYGWRLLFEGATIVYNAVFRGGYYSRGLLNKGGVYSRKYVIYKLLYVTNWMQGIKKYGSTSYLRIAQVLNGRLYIRYRNNFQKNKAEGIKKLTDNFPLFF